MRPGIIGTSLTLASTGRFSGDTNEYGLYGSSFSGTGPEPRRKYAAAIRSFPPSAKSNPSGEYTDTRFLRLFSERSFSDSGRREDSSDFIDAKSQQLPL
ncbi:MAG: hypothetical protein BWY05_01438 [Euryarchaeota archaeon ADurb.Bin165]|nr:MAG: hypothetical protein BWY05_01438 [Euryarchaeota archaeon ADurb.Bin165]